MACITRADIKRLDCPVPAGENLHRTNGRGAKVDDGRGSDTLNKTNDQTMWAWEGNDGSGE
jgi:hypothetical protein